MTITEIITIKKAVAKCHTSAVEAAAAERKSHHAAYAAEVALEELTVLIANITNADAEKRAQSEAYFDGIRNHHKL
jgi:hypothetical protein